MKRLKKNQENATERHKTEKVEQLQKYFPKNIQLEHPFEAEQIFAHQIELFADEILS